MVRYMTINKFAEFSGYSIDAIRKKITRGIWPKGKVWFNAPDGRRLIDNEGYEQWVRLQALDQSVKTPPS